GPGGGFTAAAGVRRALRPGRFLELVARGGPGAVTNAVAHPDVRTHLAWGAGRRSVRPPALLRGRGAKKGKIPVDAVGKPKEPRPSRPPILIEAKSAGDFTNVNRRRKEGAEKMAQLKAQFGDQVRHERPGDLPGRGGGW